MSKPQPLPSPDPPALCVSTVQPALPDRKYKLDFSWVWASVFPCHVVILCLEVATSLLWVWSWLWFFLHCLFEIHEMTCCFCILKTKGRRWEWWRAGWWGYDGSWQEHLSPFCRAAETDPGEEGWERPDAEREDLTEGFQDQGGR